MPEPSSASPIHTSDLHCRLNRLPRSRLHTRAVIALGIHVAALDGPEVTPAAPHIYLCATFSRLPETSHA